MGTTPDTAPDCGNAAGADEARETIADRARRTFPTLLQRILDRADGETHACRFCGTVNRLARTRRRDAACLFSGLELRRYECGGCGGIFGPLPLIGCSAAELGALYGCLYQFYAEGFSEPYQEKTFYLMNPSRRREYLNYACGDWTAGCERLRALGWQVWGYEPFQRVASPAIRTDAIGDAATRYDGLMSHNYVEHVQDPVAFFRTCHGLLKPGGVMAHSSACFDYVFEVSPFHLFFYCGRAVERVAERTGFRVRAEYRVDQEYPGHQYVCVVFEQRAA